MRDQLFDRPLDELPASQDGTAQHPALPVEVLGGRIDHDVGAQFERPREDRRTEHVVHHHLCTSGVGELADGSDIDQLEHGVARGLEEDSRRGLGQGRAPLVEVMPVDESRLHAEAAHDLVHHDEARTEQCTGRDNSVTLAAQRREGHEDGGHARACRKAGLRAFHVGKTVGEHRHRGIGEARIDHVVALAGEGSLGLGGIGIDIPTGQIEGFGSFVERTAGQAGPHGPRPGVPLRHGRRMAH